MDSSILREDLDIRNSCRDYLIAYLRVKSCDNGSVRTDILDEYLCVMGGEMDFFFQISSETTSLYYSLNSINIFRKIFQWRQCPDDFEITTYHHLLNEIIEKKLNNHTGVRF